MEAQLLDRIYLCGKNVAICGTNETRLAIFFLARHGYSTPHLTMEITGICILLFVLLRHIGIACYGCAHTLFLFLLIF
jgi:hypothetical protein